MEQQLKLPYPENYGPLHDFALGKHVTIYTKDINNSNIDKYIIGVINILKDGIETEYVQGTPINIVFNDMMDIDTFIPDLFPNFIMWKMVTMINEKIESKHFIFEEDFTQNTIKNFVDNVLIKPHVRDTDNIVLNNIIDDVLCMYKYVDHFSMYLANTCNMDDYVRLMNENQEAYDCLHADFTNVPLENINDVANALNDRLIEIIKNTKYHCFKDSFKARQSIKPKQHRELTIATGTKPDGLGGIFEKPIVHSYINGGLQGIEELFIEESSGRFAQKLSKTNVSDSGHFARLLGLNNQDTFLHKNPKYDCGTKNYEYIYIHSLKFLELFRGRYYRFFPNGMEFQIIGNEIDLVGKYIYLRSPITCKSAAEGNGVCYKCYGELAYTNRDINIGKIAAEILSSQLTQRLLSAKHLLESCIEQINWSESFREFMTVDGPLLSISSNIDMKKFTIIIDTDEIDIVNEDQDVDFNNFITGFTIVDNTGKSYLIDSEQSENMFISKDFMYIINKFTKSDGISKIPMVEVENIQMFMIDIHNNGLNEALRQLQNIINKDTVTRTYTKDQILQELMDSIHVNGIDITSVHCEIILMNQIRSSEDILECPNWDVPNTTNYTVMALSKALNNHPSISVRMNYEKIKKALYLPLSYRRFKPSFMDLFMCVTPLKLIHAEEFCSKPTYNKELTSPVIFD